MKNEHITVGTQVQVALARRATIDGRLAWTTVEVVGRVVRVTKARFFVCVEGNLAQFERDTLLERSSEAPFRRARIVKVVE